MKKIRNLLDVSRIIEKYPNLYDSFYGEAAALGKLVFAKRMERGWTQSELAKKARVESQMIYVLEGGSILLEEDNYKKIFEVLAISKKERDEWIQIHLKTRPPRRDILYVHEET